jgi:beta-D-xylosidase 4
MARVAIADVDTARHRAVALQAAREGVVLLQNGAGSEVGDAALRLPLDKAKHKIVAMVGPMANASMNLLSGYHGSPPFLTSPLDAMRAAWGESAVLYAVGCNVSDADAGTPPGIAEAVEVAKKADVVVIGLGCDASRYSTNPAAYCLDRTFLFALCVSACASVRIAMQMSCFRLLLYP